MPKNNSQIPVIVLAFANDFEPNGQYLRNIPKEAKSIRATLVVAEKEGLCKVVYLPNVTIEEIFATFRDKRYRGRIAIFHYGGHANSYELLLETDQRLKAPAHSKGLLPFLARQASLELVFLNGCSTQQQADNLIHSGVNAVIATSKSVKDGIAYQLAHLFYAGLGDGLNLFTAWEAAKSELITETGGIPRDAFLRKEVEDKNELLWKLNIRDGADEVNLWSLPIAANMPLFGLPKIEETDLPQQPYRFLERYQEKDAPIFFGRGRYIRELFLRITEKHSSPVILLTGQSGVGKSSLLDAGLSPRLQQSHQVLYIRRKQTLGLLGNVADEFKAHITTDTKPFNWHFSWLKLEERQNKPVTIIVDQVEECFTRANPDFTSELVQFLEVVNEIFLNQNQRPKGKLILSFRQEYYTVIENTLSNFKIPYQTQYLERISKAEIKAIVQGLTITKALQNQYQLTVDPNLPQVIANNLWKDKDTPIAPILQIILTKLWQQQVALKKEGTFEKIFTVADYNQLLENGILLDDFFREQMHKIESWENKIGEIAYNSGLALDILHFHTTEFNSAESRSLTAIREKYQHQAAILDELITQFKAIYLLTNTKDNQKLALAHDLLAPIIQQAEKASDKPGQRAKRILEAKAVDYELNSNTTLDVEDLALVEKGVNGMRIWTKKEQAIIEKSQKRRRNLNIIKRGIYALGILLVGGIFFSIQQQATISDKNELSEIYNIALALEQDNFPKKALDTIRSAFKIVSDDRNALQIQHNLYSNNEFYYRSMSFKDAVSHALFLEKQRTLIAVTKNQIVISDSLGNEIPLLDNSAEILAIDISPDKQYLLTGGADDIARLWDIKNRSLIELFKGHRGRIEDVAFSPKGTAILTGSTDKTAILWDLAGNIIQRFKGHTKEINSVAFSNHGDTIATGSTDKSIRLWTIDGTNFRTIDGHQDKVFDVQFSKDGQYITSASRDKTARVWTLDGELVTKFLGHQKRINKMLLTADNQLALTISDDKTIKLWDFEGKLIKTFKGHQNYVLDAQLLENDKSFMTASEDGTVKFWQMNSKVLYENQVHERAVLDIVFSPDDQFYYTAESGGVKELGENFHHTSFSFDALISKPGAIKVWTNKDHQLLNTFAEHTAGVNDITLSKDGHYLLSASDDKTAIIRNLKTNDTILLQGHQAGINSIAISMDNQLIVTGGMDSTAIFWNLKGGIQKKIKQTDAIIAMAISSDNKILTANYGGIVQIWNLNGQLLDSIHAHQGRILASQFSPDGKYILTGGQDNQVKLWSIKGKLLQTFKVTAKNNSGGRGINSVCFSPDGQLILLTAEGGVAKVYNLAGQEIQTFNDFNNTNVFSIAYDRSNHQYLIGSGDGKVRAFENILK